MSNDLSTIVATDTWDDVLEIPIGTTVVYTFKLYKADGVTPDVIESGDVIRFKVWEEGQEASPDVDADSITPATGTFTADAGTNVITSAGHGLSNNDGVILTTTATLPDPLALKTSYYVRDATTNDFKLAATRGGTEIDILDVGTGTHTWTVSRSKVEVTNLGTPGSVPAEFNVQVDQTDSSGFTAGNIYTGALLIVDNSDDGKIKPIMRGPVIPLAQGQGDDGLT